jgi:phospholipid/cholesterol/gamma-HCH transport system permease protein
MDNEMNSPAVTELRTEVQVSPDGYARIILNGRLDAQTTVACWNQLEQDLRGAKISTLEVDASGLQLCGGAGLALLRYINMGKMTPKANVSVIGLEAGLDQMFRGFTAEDYEAFRPMERIKCQSLPAETGSAVRQAASDLGEVVAFIGEIAAKLPTTIWNRKRMRWPEVRRVFELAGANAVPITSLISVLVGLIIAFEAAEPLAKFGAQIYVANMIGLVMVRELGPLLAAIMLAGRSGSAFAAEIGTMKVNEELNALETLGLDPVRFLVVQRITAGILLTPLLTFYATFMGVLGGVLVTLGLGFPLALIVHQLPRMAK